MSVFEVNTFNIINNMVNRYIKTYKTAIREDMKIAVLITSVKESDGKATTIVGLELTNISDKPITICDFALIPEDKKELEFPAQNITFADRKYLLVNESTRLDVEFKSPDRMVNSFNNLKLLIKQSGFDEWLECSLL